MTKIKALPEHILWLDLETSGSDKNYCTIVEVGAILTDQNLNELGRFSSVVGSYYEEVMSSTWPDVVQEMHKTSGLWDELKTPGNPQIEEVEKNLLEWLDSYHPSKTHVALAGSGVGHFDRGFIDKFWPTFSKRLTYWPLDISVPRRFLQLFDFPWIEDAKTHRALDDALHHLDEAIYFRRLITILKAYMRVNGYTTDPNAFHADDWIWD